MGIGTFFGNTAETGNNIQTDGLVFYYDAAYKKSYPRTGIIAYNLASGSLTPPLTLTGGPTYVGMPTASFDLDGINDYLNITADAKYNQLGTGPWTFSIFMKKTATTPGGNYDGIFYMSATNRLKFQASDQIIKLEIGDSDLELFDYGASMVGSWHNITVVRENNGNALGYVDSVLKGTTSYSGKSFTDSNNMHIGVNAQYLPAQISTIAFYNRALSAGDVLQNFNAQKERFGL